MKVNENGLAWKTSDWIIQEIGLAIGRGMKLILLIENDVRRPGGLFGDLEYISFERNHPESSFNSILGMISQLTKNDNIGVANSNVGSETSSALTQGTADGEYANPQAPDDTWDEDNFELQFMIAIFEKNSDRASSINEFFLNKYRSHPDITARWNATIELFKIRFGDGGSLQSIQEIAGQNPKNSDVLRAAARACLHYEDTERAKHYFSEAAKFESDQAKKISLFGELAELTQDDPTCNALTEMRILSTAPEFEKIALKKLRELKGRFGDNVLRAAMLERELVIDPADTDKRFEIAYLHHDLGSGLITKT